MGISLRILGRQYDPEQLTEVLADLRLRAGERFSYVYKHRAPWAHELRVEGIGHGGPAGITRVVSRDNTPAQPEWCPGPEAQEEVKAELLGLSYAEDLQLMAEFGRAVLAGPDGMVRAALARRCTQGRSQAAQAPRVADRAVRRRRANTALGLLATASAGAHAMTMRFTLTLAREAGDGSSAAMTRSVVIERDMLAPETLGFTLAEAKAILAELQAAIVADQVAMAAHEKEERCCGNCGAARRVKGHRQLTCRTVFGTVQVKALRLRQDSVTGDRASLSPAADLLPERTTRSCSTSKRVGGRSSPMDSPRTLGDVLPLGKPVAPESVRRHLHAVAVHEEGVLATKPIGALADGPAYVGVDGGFVRDRAGSWFEVIAASSSPAFAETLPRTRSHGRRVLRLPPDPR
jgi:hypothetical protein